MPETRQIKYDTSKPGSGENAIFAVALAALSYKSQLAIEKELYEVGYRDTKVVFFNTDLAGGFIIEWDDVIAVAFRGSTNWREWVNNCNIWLRRTRYGRVHGGFCHTIEHIGPSIYSIILPRLLSGLKLVVTGHSRGGALAFLFASMVKIKGHNPHCIYTFGSPRYCDGEFADFMSGEVYRKLITQSYIGIASDFFFNVYYVIFNVVWVGGMFLGMYARYGIRVLVRYIRRRM